MLHYMLPEGVGDKLLVIFRTEFAFCSSRPYNFSNINKLKLEGNDG